MLHDPEFISRYMIKRRLREREIVPSRHAVISISDSKVEVEEMTEALEDFSKCILCFSDDDKVSYSKDRIVDFLNHRRSSSHVSISDRLESYRELTLDDAYDIISFAWKCHDEEKIIVVHCFAGISRSAAVAKFIHDRIHELPSPVNTYNSSIYRLLCDMLEAMQKNDCTSTSH